MPTLFEDWQRMLAPKWLRDGMGDFWLSAQGMQKDRIEQYMRDFILSRFPDFAAPDSLKLLGAERQLEPPYSQGLYDNLPAWRTKLKQAFQLWVWGGTPYGLLRELKSAFPGDTGSNMSISYQTQQGLVVFMNSVDTGDPATSLVYPAISPPHFSPLAFSSPPRWNTFIVRIAVSGTHPWVGGLPPDTSNEAETARRIIQRWRAGHSECRKIIVQDGGVAFSEYDLLWGVFEDFIGDVHAWGDGVTWGQKFDPSGAATVYWTPPPQ